MFLPHPSATSGRAGRRARLLTASLLVLTPLALAPLVQAPIAAEERTRLHAAVDAAPVVWAVHDGVKVKQTGLAHPDKARNAVWDGTSISLVAARNEIVAFQVIVEGGAEGIEKLSASLPALTRTADAAGGGSAGAGAAVIRYQPPAADPTEYRGRPIQLFSVNYMLVERATRATWGFTPDSPSAPADPLGWTPVQLVPENARAGRGGFPLRVAPNRNQAIWIEVYVDRALPPGTYRGEIAIATERGSRALPVTLDVVDVTLPDENTLRAMVYYEPSQPELYSGRNLDAAYHRFAKRQRVEFVHAYTSARVRAARGRFDGTDFTAAQGYEGPGQSIGNRIVPRTFYGPGADFQDPERVWTQADEWMTFVRAELPHAYTFLYMPDEPRPAQFPAIVALGQRLKRNPGIGRTLPTFVTKQYVPEIAGAIDIWCAGAAHFDTARVRAERAAGKQGWFYNGQRPSSGVLLIDSPATDARVAGWTAFRHHTDGYFYWHAVHWLHNRQKRVGSRVQNVWLSPVTFDNRSEGKDDNGFLNGDGVLVYPGEDVLHQDQNRGIAGPISTIQMANLRRGLQDHVILTLAERAGLKDDVSTALTRLVPHVLGDADPKGPAGFSENGNDYESARRALLRAIAAASRSKR